MALGKDDRRSPWREEAGTEAVPGKRDLQGPAIIIRVGNMNSSYSRKGDL